MRQRMAHLRNWYTKYAMRILCRVAAFAICALHKGFQIRSSVMSVPVLEYVVLGIAVLSLVSVVVEIVVKDPGALREIVTDVAKMARPETKSAEIRHLPVRRPESVLAIRRAA
jgi:hypothetical protein